VLFVAPLATLADTDASDPARSPIDSGRFLGTGSWALATDGQRMADKKRGLGRGLEALLGSSPPPAAAVATTAPTSPGERLTALPLDLLGRGKYQPRLDMRPETLQELADSIKAPRPYGRSYHTTK